MTFKDLDKKLAEAAKMGIRLDANEPKNQKKEKTNVRPNGPQQSEQL